MSTLSTRSQVRRFRFTENESLYLDPLGRRVVADFEGTGAWRVEVAAPSLLVLRGEEWTETFQQTFEESLSVLGLGPGETQIAVWVGEAPTGPSVEVAGEYAGAGWVVACEGALRIDDRHEAAPAPSEGLAIPFFRSAVADRLVIVPAPGRLERVDAFAIDELAALKERGWKVQNVSRVVHLKSRFADGTEGAGPVASHLNAATWTCAIPADNQGLRLRKTYDRFHGRQRARVFVDGTFAGWWYEPAEDRQARWAIAEYGLDPALTAGKSSVTLAIDPPAGSPLWSVGQMEVWAMRA